METLEVAMGLIAGAGDSKSYSMEAISMAKEGNFKEAREAIQKATEAMVGTHDIQTQLIRDEMTGKSAAITLLMVHAQDHINMAMMMRDLAIEFIDLYEKLSTK
ncbi:PTS lactose/cellobiose transporter subunit IIA [Oscillospiraceae bacterium PP1C4]